MNLWWRVCWCRGLVYVVGGGVVDKGLEDFAEILEKFSGEVFLLEV